jgi:hypothetical protein
VVDESLYHDVMYILKRAMKGSVIEFHARGREHYTHPEQMFVKGDVIILTHPEVTTNYNDGNGYVDMRENKPTHHTFSLHTCLIKWIGERNFRNGHVLLTSAGRAIHFYFDERGEMS